MVIFFDTIAAEDFDAFGSSGGEEDGFVRLAN